MKIQKTLFVLILFFSQLIYADPYTTGDKLAALSLNDQHDNPGFINEQTRIVLFSRDKAGGDLLALALSRMPDNYLSQRHIIFISDISQMPGLISKYMAIPSMRKRNYSILLDRDGVSTKRFPEQADAATLIYIETLRIKNIVHLSSSDEIKQALKLKPK